MIFLKNDETFHQLYALHSGGVKRFLTGMVGRNEAVAEELTQDAFLKAWKGLASFSAKSSLKTWLYSVAVNTARDWLRAHGHRPMGELSTDTPAPLVDNAETRAVQEALLELDADNRELLMLHYYEDFSLQEISKVLKIPQGTVKTRLHQCKARPRPLLIKKRFDV